MNRDIAAVFVLLLVAFSFAETILALMSGPTAGPIVVSPPSDRGIAFFQVHAFPLSVIGWVLSAVSIGLYHFQASGRHSRLRSMFASNGFNSDVYDLMVKMRGGDSRLALLRSMSSPRHRNELSGITGLDWKEVDRQISVLEKYELVKMHAQSGTVRLYELTEQGRLLLKVISELDDGKQSKN